MKIECMLNERDLPEPRPLDAPALLCCLQRACRENGVTFEPLLTLDENRAGLAAAEVFLRECQTLGLDPRTLLQALAMYWGRFRTGLLKAHDGRAVFLPVGVCFLSFYHWRREIIQWLKDNRRIK